MTGRQGDVSKPFASVNDLKERWPDFPPGTEQFASLLRRLLIDFGEVVSEPGSPNDD